MAQVPFLVVFLVFVKVVFVVDVQVILELVVDVMFVDEVQVVFVDTVFSGICSRCHGDVRGSRSRFIFGCC